ncbi:secreted RxLR effector protein 78-like [Rutidosis leptorrhynchoides]|uniref:secreted RxLR effector protein 78-like n=1 Tax=Rutidosis leptorrhynchoides TaxID=125765 RepID=UPI003A99097F
MSSFYEKAPVIDSVISNEQTAFIQGRQILDGPLMLSEIIGWFKKKKKNLLVFKVDFEKAFDSVDWHYIDFMLLQMGFGDKWRRWIKACLSSARTSILVNCSPTSEFSIRSGLRQGDPLSPFLFIIVIEGLHLALKDAVANNLIKGVSIGLLNISHFLFADDVAIIS